MVLVIFSALILLLLLRLLGAKVGSSRVRSSAEARAQAEPHREREPRDNPRLWEQANHGMIVRKWGRLDKLVVWEFPQIGDPNIVP